MDPAAATFAAQSLYAKLQKLSEDIQLQHSIINAQKETVLKSRQRVMEPQKVIGVQSPDTHAVHAHAGTVLQHRAMIVKHYELIQQHKQMVKEQGLHVQNLTSALQNIQQETSVVDELMNTKMAESIRTRAIAANPQNAIPNPNHTPAIPSSTIIDNYHDFKPTNSKDKSTTHIGPKRNRTRKYSNERIVTRPITSSPSSSPSSPAPFDSTQPLSIETESVTTRTTEKEPSSDVTTDELTTAATSTSSTPTEKITTTTIITTITSTSPSNAAAPTSTTSTTISSSMTTTTTSASRPEPLQSSSDEPTPLSP